MALVSSHLYLQENAGILVKFQMNILGSLKKIPIFNFRTKMEVGNQGGDGAENEDCVGRPSPEGTVAEGSMRGCHPSPRRPPPWASARDCTVLAAHSHLGLVRTLG